MEQYLIDTNVVSDYFSASLSTTGMQFMDTIIDAIPNLSIITPIELLCWKKNHSTEQKVKDFISDSVILNIDSDSITQCVELRKHKNIKTPDAIIAATSLARGYILITNNEKDFSGIKNLRIVNPMRL